MYNYQKERILKLVNDPALKMEHIRNSLEFIFDEQKELPLLNEIQLKYYDSLMREQLQYRPNQIGADVLAQQLYKFKDMVNNIEEKRIQHEIAQNKQNQKNEQMEDQICMQIQNINDTLIDIKQTQQNINSKMEIINNTFNKLDLCEMTMKQNLELKNELKKLKSYSIIMSENKPKKIMVMKTCHKVESTAANQHNIILDVKEVEQIKLKNNICNSNIIEWYIRTLGDEIYKLSFIDDKIYYRIKMFWPQQYQDHLKNPKDSDVEYFLEPFKSFDLEDYFDIIIFPTITQNTIELRIALNSFTYPLPQQLHPDNLIQDIQGLELFYDHRDSQGINPNSNQTLLEFTKLLLEKYIFRQKDHELRAKGLKINASLLQDRLKAIIDEETRLVLFELYADL